MSCGDGAGIAALHRVLRRARIRGRRRVVQGYQVRTTARAPVDRDRDRASGDAPRAAAGPCVKAFRKRGDVSRHYIRLPNESLKWTSANTAEGFRFPPFKMLVHPGRRAAY